MTALDFWRIAYPADKMPDAADCVGLNGRPVSREEDVWTCAPPLFTPDLLASEGGVMHVTVRDARSRTRSKTHACHLWKADFPEGSFYQLSEDAYVASPQFAFLQMAQQLSLAQLVALGDELCGHYAFGPRAAFGVRSRTMPLVSIEAIASFIEQARSICGGNGRASGPTGIRKAERALVHMVERSASPRETMLEMLLSMPCRLGGYGLPRPSMNAEITLDEKARAIARRRTLRADLFWPERRLDLEFNGRAAHSGEEAELSDRARTNALQLMGYTVREITGRQLDDLAQFDAIALHIAKLLGKRVEPRQRGPLPQRLRLRGELFRWNRADGRAPRS